MKTIRNVLKISSYELGIWYVFTWFTPKWKIFWKFSKHCQNGHYHCFGSILKVFQIFFHLGVNIVKTYNTKSQIFSWPKGWWADCLRKRSQSKCSQHKQKWKLRLKGKSQGFLHQYQIYCGAIIHIRPVLQDFRQFVPSPPRKIIYLYTCWWFPQWFFLLRNFKSN